MTTVQPIMLGFLSDGTVITNGTRGLCAELYGDVYQLTAAPSAVYGQYVLIRISACNNAVVYYVYDLHKAQYFTLKKDMTKFLIHEVKMQNDSTFQMCIDQIKPRLETTMDTYIIASAPSPNLVMINDVMVPITMESTPTITQLNANPNYALLVISDQKTTVAYRVRSCTPALANR